MRVVLLMAALALNAGAAWHRVVTPHFEILTDTGEKRGRELILQLEQLRQVFEQSSGAHSPLPLRVFLFRSEREFDRIKPSPHTKGFFQGGPERDFIALRELGEETRRALNHEYIHLVLSHSTAALPLWLEEGTAEFYSTIDVQQDRVTIGLPIPQHPRVLAAAGWLDAGSFFNLGRSSALHNDALREGAFYAQSWAMVHMLNMAPGFRQHISRFAELLEQSTPPMDAFSQAFSLSPADAVSRLRAYVAQGSYPVARVQAGPSASAQIDAAGLSQSEIALAKVELFLLLDRPAEAAKLLDTLPDGVSETETARGLYALAIKETAAASERFRKAIELGSRDATPYFEYAMLLRDARAPSGDVRRYLAEAAARNPNLAEAQFLIGLSEQQQGRHSEALAAFQSAVAVLPRQSYFWHAMAVSLRALDRVPEAARAARKAMGTARSNHEFDMASALANSLAAPATVAKGTAAPAVKVPDSWSMPKGDARAEGTLEHVDCLGKAARFHIRTASGPLRLMVENPGDVLLRTESALTFTFSCGPQQPRKVTVEYRTAGTLTAIEFH